MPPSCWPCRTYYALLVRNQRRGFYPAVLPTGWQTIRSPGPATASTSSGAFCTEQLRRRPATARIGNRSRLLQMPRPATPVVPSRCDVFEASTGTCSASADSSWQPIADWLARHVLDQVGYTGGPAGRAVRPPCGSGRVWCWHAAAASFLIRHSRPIVRRPEHAGRVEQGELPAGRRRSAPGAGQMRNAVCCTIRSKTRTRSCSPPHRLGWAVKAGSRCHWDIHSSVRLSQANPPGSPGTICSEEDRRATKPLWEQSGLPSLLRQPGQTAAAERAPRMLMLYTTADAVLAARRAAGDGHPGPCSTLGAGDGYPPTCASAAQAPAAGAAWTVKVGLRPLPARPIGPGHMCSEGHHAGVQLVFQ